MLVQYHLYLAAQPFNYHMYDSDYQANTINHCSTIIREYVGMTTACPRHPYILSDDDATVINGIRLVITAGHDADMPIPPYIQKACNRPNAAFVSLFRYLTVIYGCFSMKGEQCHNFKGATFFTTP